MSLTRRDRLAVRAGAGVVAVLVLVRAVDTGIRQYSALKLEALQAQALADRAAGLVANASEIEAQLAAASAALAGQSARLVTGESTGEAAAAASAVVSRWALSAGASIHAIETVVSDSTATFRQLVIRATLEGTLEAVVALLDSLERSDIMLAVSRLSIDAHRESILAVRAEVTGWLHPAVAP